SRKRGLMRLVSEEALSAAAARYPQMRCRLSEYRDDMLDNPVAGWCLRNYLILSECPELLGEPDLSEAEMYWSRYYWLVRFARVWASLVGYDAGLEQQVFQFLEHPPDGPEVCVEVVAAAEKAAAEQLRAAGIG